MSTLSSPDNIEAHDTSDPFNPPAAYAAMQTSIQAAFNKRQVYTYRWANSGARTSQTGMVAGDEGYQTDTQVVYKYNGTAWKAWHTSQPRSFTPTWTNLTVGNGTQSWTYTLAAGRVGVSGFITLGSTSSVGSNPYHTLPLPANGYATSAPNSGNDRWLGSCSLNDAGTNFYRGDVETIGVSSVIYARILANNASATYATIQGVTSAIPFSWGNGDYITADYSYIAD